MLRSTASLCHPGVFGAGIRQHGEQTRPAFALPEMPDAGQSVYGHNIRARDLPASWRQTGGMRKEFRLLDSNGREYPSAVPGTLGGHRRSRIYGRLDCPGALRWIARGHYVRHRVFFADAVSAVAAGYRPCAVCLSDAYAAWKHSSERP